MGFGEEGRIWWGDGELSVGEAGCWQVGPYEFWLARSQHEWRFGGRQGDDPGEARPTWRSAGVGDLPEDAVIRRLGLGQTRGGVRLTPQLADRSVVIQPAQPIALPPHQELALYFSSPLWLKVEVDEPLVEFLQQPMQRPSDTWFGPNTREGEICYSLRTSARLRLEDLPDRPHRAVSELRVINRAGSPLPIDRVLVPLPTMSLFVSDSGQLWTQQVTYERRDDGATAELKLGSRPPSRVAGARLLAGPREEPQRGSLIRVFGGLIGGW